MNQLLAAFDFIPGWMYAAALAVLTLAGGGYVGYMHIQVADAKRDTAQALRSLYDERGQHAKALAEQTALVLKATNELTAARAAQEKRDGDAQATIAQLGEDLRRRSRGGGGSGLRDPNATACSGQPAAGPGPAASPGGTDLAEAGGLLSGPLEDLLLSITSEADSINAAYASCRDDALTLRATISRLSPSPATQVPSP